MSIRRINLVLGTLLLASLAGTALAQSSTTPGSGDSMGKSVLSKDAMFMRHAAADSLAEIQMGRIALDKSPSAPVKELAQRIVDDHTKANDQLMSIAQRQQVALPTEPMPMEKKRADQLKAMSSASFDQAYARAMVKDHRKAIKVFGMESRKASSDEVRQFASDTLPALKTHLQMAEQIAGEDGMHGSGHHAMKHDADMPMGDHGPKGMPAPGGSTH